MLKKRVFGITSFIVVIILAFSFSNCNSNSSLDGIWEIAQNDSWYVFKGSDYEYYWNNGQNGLKGAFSLNSKKTELTLTQTHFLNIERGWEQNSDKKNISIKISENSLEFIDEGITFIKRNSTIFTTEEETKSPPEASTTTSSVLTQTEVYFIAILNGTEDGMIITHYNSDAIVVNIPATIQGKPVREIGYKAFEDKSITSVTIPNSVTLIADYAFAHNQLTSVIIPNSVTYIGKSALAWNQLTSVNIPNSVHYIGESAFYGNQLISITIPNSVTTIESQAFNYNPLTDVTILNGVIEIGLVVFDSGNLTSITIGANVPINPVTFFQSGFEIIYENSGKQAGIYTRPNATTTAWIKQ